MKFGKVASGTEYRIHEQLKNLPSGVQNLK